MEEPIDVEGRSGEWGVERLLMGDALLYTIIHTYLG